jgi:hypothetical protein
MSARLADIPAKFAGKVGAFRQDLPTFRQDLPNWVIGYPAGGSLGCDAG